LKLSRKYSFNDFFWRCHIIEKFDLNKMKWVEQFYLEIERFLRGMYFKLFVKEL
jgi:hypothetical protein